MPSSIQILFRNMIIASLEKKTASKNGCKSGTATEHLHNAIALGISEMLQEQIKGNHYRLSFITEWAIDEDAFGERFNIDLAVYIQKKEQSDFDYDSGNERRISVYLPDETDRSHLQFIDDIRPVFYVLVKHPLSSINKNRFNAAISEIGEAARICFNPLGEPSGNKAIQLSLVCNNAPVYQEGGGIKAVEKTNPIETDLILEHLRFKDSSQRYKTGAWSCLVRYDYTAEFKKELQECKTKTDYLNAIQIKIIENEEFLDSNTIDCNDFVSILKSLTPQEFLGSGGRKGKRFS